RYAAAERAEIGAGGDRPGRYPRRRHGREQRRSHAADGRRRARQGDRGVSGNHADADLGLADSTESHTLTLTLSRFGGEGTGRSEQPRWPPLPRSGRGWG